MRIVRRRVMAALSIGLTLALLPTAANACEDDNLTLVYVYRKVDPAGPATWANSGRQTLIMVREGHRWTRHIEASLLPDDVCGPGWAVQEDQTHGLSRDEVPTVVDRATGVGVLGWPPIIAARHKDLGYYLAVPPCDTEPPVDEETPPPTDTPTPTVTPTEITSEPEQPPVAPQVKPAAPAVPVQGAPAFTG